MLLFRLFNNKSKPKRSYYKVKWSYGSDGLDVYTTIVKASSDMKAGFKVERQHAFPIYIHSIEKG